MKANRQARILVVDDDDKLRALLIRYLGEEGFNVAGVADGESMDRFLSHNPVDLLVLDLMLPGKDGFAILRELRSRDVRTPVICLTARDAVDDRVKGLDLGADDYLAKPFSFSSFLYVFLYYNLWNHDLPE